MSSKWPMQPFDSLYAVPSRNGLMRPKKIRGSGIKMVNMGELFAYDRIRDQYMERVPLSDSEAERFLLEKGDLLFARASLTLEGSGKCAIVYEADNPRTFESHIIRVRLKGDRASPLFYYYFFRSSFGRIAIQAITDQVAAAGIRASDLARLLVFSPKLADQQRIAHVLGTLDDKIELNRRMNRTLEKMAAAMFKSWFIDFDPVRAKAEGRDTGLPAEIPDLFPDGFEESEFGPIPRGWGVGPLSELAELTTRSVKPAEQPDALWEHYSIAAYDEGQQPHRDLGHTIKSGKYAVPRLSVLVSKLNPQFPRIWLPHVNDPAFSICSTEFMPFVARNDYSRPFIYEMMKSHSVQNAIKAHASGSTGSRQRVKPKEIASLVVITPPPDAIDAFSDTTAQLHSRVLLNRRQNRRLAGLRDTLLPKLLSGEIEVPEAEAVAEDAA